jgi:hypothetical protein
MIEAGGHDQSSSTMGTDRTEPILTIRLRNTHRVYRDGRGGYLVEQEDAHGVQHTQRVSQEATDWLGSHLAGSVTTRQEAAELLETVAQDLQLPFSYGYKLGYYAQDILLTLVAEGRATVDKVGRGFEYRIQR